MNNLFTLFSPSMIGLNLTGFTVLILLILLIINFKQIKKLNFYNKIIIISLISITLGVHSLLHLGAEIYYNYNPIKI